MCTYCYISGKRAGLRKLGMWGEGGTAGDLETAAAGALPLAGPALAGAISGHHTPLDPAEVEARTSSGGLKGSLLGGGIGALGGAGIGALLGALREHYGIGPDVTSGQGAGYGAAIGGGLGLMGGGALGALRGRHQGEHEAIQNVQDEIHDLEHTMKAIERAKEEGASEGYRAALSGWGAGL